MLYAGTSLDKARAVFADYARRQPAARLTIRQRSRMLDQWRQASPRRALGFGLLGPTLNQVAAAGRPAFFRSITPDIIPSADAIAELAAVEDVIFIGCPSGLRDEINANPIVRRGITATPVWYDFQGRPQFLIDEGVFPGSSGSPVFIFNQGAYPTKNGLTIGNRLLFLGMVWQSMLRDDLGNTDLHRHWCGPQQLRPTRFY